MWRGIGLADRSTPAMQTPAALVLSGLRAAHDMKAKLICNSATKSFYARQTPQLLIFFDDIYAS
jgi:hypothetical protein